MLKDAFTQILGKKGVVVMVFECYSTVKLAKSVECTFKATLTMTSTSPNGRPKIDKY